MEENKRICQKCGASMTLLLFNYVCDRDCDRVPDALETEITLKYGPPVSVKRCPVVTCGSLNTEQFITADGYHCWDCGAVWADPT